MAVGEGWDDSFTWAVQAVKRARKKRKVRYFFTFITDFHYRTIEPQFNNKIVTREPPKPFGGP